MLRVKIPDSEIIGKKFKSVNYNDFTVISISNLKQAKHRLFDIEFDEINGMKYRNTVLKRSIFDGSVKNPFYPSIYGIGYLGNATVIGNQLQYSRWSDMLSRCYNEKAQNYKRYGAKGVSVCDRWHCFEHFLEDFPKIDGYDKNNLSNLQIDKDIKSKGDKIYSLETCMFVSMSENMMEMNRRISQKDFIAISPKGEIFEHHSQQEFAKMHNLTRRNIGHVLNGKREHHKGWKFKYKNII